MHRRWLIKIRYVKIRSCGSFYEGAKEDGKNKQVFCVDHDRLEKGMYVSRIDGDVITYDLRMVKPNQGGYLENAGLHTFEHLFATYVRNSKMSEQIIYVGPMGCRTGFYLLTRDTMSKEQALLLVKETLAFIAEFKGEIPGASLQAKNVEII